MARADLLLKLVEAFSKSDNALFKSVVESIIAEERQKQHGVLANQLENVLSKFNGGNSLRYNLTSTDKMESFLLQLQPKISLNNLVLTDEVIEIVNELIEEHNRSELLRSYNLEPRNRILLVGPPGNGKTSLAEAISESLMIPFYVIRYDGIIGSFLGETASRLKQMFEFIKTRNCVLFFDEFDAIGKERGDIHETGEIKRVVSSLLMQIDKLPSYVIVIAATNHPELLDRAVWRRFQIRVELHKPDKKMIEQYVEKIKSNSSFLTDYSTKPIVTKLSGLNFSELNEFFLAVQRKCVLKQPQANINEIIQDCMRKLHLKYKQDNE